MYIKRRERGKIKKKKETVFVFIFIFMDMEVGKWNYIEGGRSRGKDCLR